MDKVEKGWQENREEYLEKAYGALRSEEGLTPLNEAVDTWQMLTDDASEHYFWRALGLFQVTGNLNIDEDSGNKLLDVDPEISMHELLEEEPELVQGDKTNVRKTETDEYRSFEGFETPLIPLFIPWEHMERHGYEIFPHESSGLRGLAGRQKTTDGSKESWIGLYSSEDDREGSLWLNQVFRDLQVEGKKSSVSTEEIFSDRNRQNYADRIWASQPLRIRQRSQNIWDAAVQTVEEEIPHISEEYEERWGEEIEEFEALKRELRLAVGDSEYDEENPTYIEEIVREYYEEGLNRDSRILQPYLQKIESTPIEEGDMNLAEATRGSKTSEGRKERNQEYMSHFLDLVWQMADQKYSE